MPPNRVEYRFVLDAGFTPETIPMARLAEYMADLAKLYGERDAVHFLRVEPSSTAILSTVDQEADVRVSERLQALELDEDPPIDAAQAFESITQRVVADRGRAYITSGPARVLDFPTGELLQQSPTYGPFWQPGSVTGTVYWGGGKGRIVSVKLEHTSGATYLCKAKRTTAKRLLDHIWGPPLRVTGRGRWLRTADGEWRLLQFNIDNFSILETESLTETIARLRAVGGTWKNPSPLFAGLTEPSSS